MIRAGGLETGLETKFLWSWSWSLSRFSCKVSVSGLELLRSRSRRLEMVSRPSEKFKIKGKICCDFKPKRENVSYAVIMDPLLTLHLLMFI